MMNVILICIISDHGIFKPLKIQPQLIEHEIPAKAISEHILQQANSSTNASGEGKNVFNKCQFLCPNSDQVTMEINETF